MLVHSCATSKPVHSPDRNATILNDSVIVDPDGNNYSVKLLTDGKLWMTTNLKTNIPGSYCYDNAEANCDQYGRLYSWESAKQSCELLGDRWRLPTAEEWGQITKLYGSNGEDSNLFRKTAYKTLLAAGNSGFNALLGGGRAPGGEYGRLDAHGFYWTATERGTGMAVFYNFARGSQALYQQDEGEKTRAFTVRCVKSNR